MYKRLTDSWNYDEDWYVSLTGCFMPNDASDGTAGPGQAGDPGNDAGVGPDGEPADGFGLGPPGAGNVGTDPLGDVSVDIGDISDMYGPDDSFAGVIGDFFGSLVGTPTGMTMGQHQDMLGKLDAFNESMPTGFSPFGTPTSVMAMDMARPDFTVFGIEAEIPMAEEVPGIVASTIAGFAVPGPFGVVASTIAKSAVDKAMGMPVDAASVVGSVVGGLAGNLGSTIGGQIGTSITGDMTGAIAGATLGGLAASNVASNAVSAAFGPGVSQSPTSGNQTTGDISVGVPGPAEPTAPSPQSPGVSVDEQGNYSYASFSDFTDTVSGLFGFNEGGEVGDTARKRVQRRAFKELDKFSENIYILNKIGANISDIDMKRSMANVMVKGQDPLSTYTDMLTSKERKEALEGFKKPSKELKSLIEKTKKKLPAPVAMQAGGKVPAPDFIGQPASPDSLGPKNIADDVPKDGEDGGFVINAPAVAQSGRMYIESLISDAIDSLKKKGVSVSDRSGKPVGDDRVPLLVSKGEVYLPPEIAEEIGMSRLEKINNRGKKKVSQLKEQAEEEGFVPAPTA